MRLNARARGLVLGVELHVHDEHVLGRTGDDLAAQSPYGAPSPPKSLKIGK